MHWVDVVRRLFCVSPITFRGTSTSLISRYMLTEQSRSSSFYLGNHAMSLCYGHEAPATQ